MFDVITIGSATKDVFMEDDSFIIAKSEDSPTGEIECFPLGSKIDIDKIVFSTGGGGTNSAVTFARQGHNVASICIIGADKDGKEIIEVLENEGVDTSLIQKHDDNITSYSVILVHSSGSRTILNYKGEAQHFDVNKIDLDKIDAKWLYLGSVGNNWDVMYKLVEHAKSKGIKLAINTTGSMFKDGPDALLKVAGDMDIFTCNREEGSQLTGIKREDWDGIASKLHEIVGGIVSVSGGIEGVLVIDKEGKKYKAGIPDSPIEERTGAGDAFASGFVAEYMRSEDITKAIQFAVANASSVVSKFGAKDGILKKDETSEWPLVEVEVI
ncbi:MAG: carbohydrate kinase family protein [Parcubacteria group bacterium]